MTMLIAYPFYTGPMAAERRIRSSPFWQSMKPGVWVIYNVSDNPESPDLKYGQVKRVEPWSTARGHGRMVMIQSVVIEEGMTTLYIGAYDVPQIVITGIEGTSELSQFFGGARVVHTESDMVTGE
jgi:hypothetical protein